MHIGIDDHPDEEIGESSLDFGLVQGEELFELVHNEHGVASSIPPASHHIDCHVRIVKGQHLLDDLGIPCHDPSESPAEREDRDGSWRAHQT